MAAYQLADIQENQTKQKLVALRAFLLLSIFIYVSLFYVFKISTTSPDLYSTSKFWFFISNTLILIISIDFGTFSSSPSSKYQYDQPHHVLDEFHDPRKISSFDQIRRSGSTKKCIVREDRSNVGGLIIPSSKECTYKFNPSSLITTTNDLEQLVENDEDGGNLIDHDFHKKPLLLEYDAKGGDAKIEVFDEEKFAIEKSNDKKIATLIQPAEPEQNHGGNVEEDNEFSTMSTEELNRRVEEFIHISYRQIRLEAETSC